MKRPAVRCRCGHQVLAKEVLRTDLYERPSGREYVYVKYRCKRCKRVGETFIAENRWDWRIFEVPQNEMSESEFEAFAEQNPITSEDLLDFHLLRGKIATTSELARAADAAKTSGIAAEKAKRNSQPICRFSRRSKFISRRICRRPLAMRVLPMPGPKHRPSFRALNLNAATLKTAISKAATTD